MAQPRNRRGVALLTAIWLLAVLLVLVAGLVAVVHTEMQVADNFGQLLRARWAARTGICKAEARLITDAALPYTALDTGGRLLLQPDETAGTPTPNIAMDYQTTVEDEAGKINLNTATTETLLTFFPAEVVDCIIDWRDADSDPQPQGAEDDYYTGLATPYHCKNGPFTTVNELLLVKGVTKDMLAQKMTDDGRTVADLLTVNSVDTNLDAQGQARVNIATATKDALTKAFGTPQANTNAPATPNTGQAAPVLTADEIDAIIKQRGSTPFKSPADILETPNLARAKVAQIYDRLTTTTDQARTGLVNINTAPAEVLMALPGMDATTAQSIVQTRDTDGPFQDVGALLSEEWMSTEVFRSVADSLTTRSRTFRVLSTGQNADGVKTVVTCLLQLETGDSGTVVRRLYWQE